MLAGFHNPDITIMAISTFIYIVFNMREDYGFNYGERRYIYPEGIIYVLGKIRYIDLMEIGYEYKLVRHKNNAEF